MQIRFQTSHWYDPAGQGAVRATTGSHLALLAFVGLVAITLSFLETDLANAAPHSEPQSFEAIQKAVEDHFQTAEDYLAGDLITQSQIVEVLKAVHSEGWLPANAKQIVELGVADNAFLAKELSDTSGRKFMRKVAKYPGAYAHLDQLSTISRGQKLVRDLIRQRGGDKFVEYLATTKSGNRLGSMLADVQHGVDLNKPTGRIYTADDLLAELRRAYGQQFQK